MLAIGSEEGYRVVVKYSSHVYVPCRGNVWALNWDKTGDCLGTHSHTHIVVIIYMGTWSFTLTLQVLQAYHLYIDISSYVSQGTSPRHSNREAGWVINKMTKHHL